MRGLYFGLERAEEHGLFYTLVEMKDVRTTLDSVVSFLVGERELFGQRPRSLKDIRLKRVTWAGVTRDTLVMRGRLERGNLVVTCMSTALLCPDKVMVFHKGSWRRRAWAARARATSGWKSRSASRHIDRKRA